MKRIISFMLVMLLLFSGVVVANAAAFRDMPSEHWSFASVMELVNDGTINGYEDGTFRPDGTVTRAEFVKMIGSGTLRRESNFDDIDTNHWAYEYIMTSGLDAAQNNLFMPDQAITRNEVAVLLWKRAGSATDIHVPPVINRQGDNQDATAWVYHYGLMVGDDYVDLRLNDTLTRSEAATLIVRSRKVNAQSATTDFMNSMDAKMLQTAYDAFSVIDKPYAPDAKITYGELSLAAARIACGQRNPTYANISASASFRHTYAQSYNMLCRYCLGEDKDNAEQIDKNVTVQDAIASLMFATIRGANSYIGDTNTKDNYYPEITSVLNDDMNRYLTTAYKNGICFNSDGMIHPLEEISLKQFACLLLEFDGISGFSICDQLGFNSYSRDCKIRSNLAGYPSNAAQYKKILAAIPNYVYEKSFLTVEQSPKDSYMVSEAFKSVFETMLVTLVATGKDKGATLNITYYPSLVVNNGNGYTMRVKINVEQANEGVTIGSLIKTSTDVAAAKIISTGDSFFADIETGHKLDDVYLPANLMVLNQIVD